MAAVAPGATGMSGGMIAASADFAQLQLRLADMARKLAEARAAPSAQSPRPDKWRSALQLWPLF